MPFEMKNKNTWKQMLELWEQIRGFAKSRFAFVTLLYEQLPGLESSS